MPRSILVAASFPPQLGGIESLLYQTNRRLSEPPLVLAPAPASACAIHVRQLAMGVVGRLAYRPLWRVHPSLHYLLTFWRPTVRAIAEVRPAALQIGHIYLASL